ncbi:MAG: phenylalanine--tRNA ligase subunit beta [bacterium]
MPVVGIPVGLLSERIGVVLERDALIGKLQHLGCDVEGYATLQRFKCRRCGNIMEITETQDPPVVCRRCGVDYGDLPQERGDLGTSDVIRMELLAVRPDMFDPGGLARTLRGYLGQDRGLREYALGPPVARVEVDPEMFTEHCPRPAIACAVVRGIRLDDDIIKEVMNLQENLHWALGRDRKHASIGVYDLDTLAWPEFRYRAVAPGELTFVPLGYDPAVAENHLTPGAILAQHPKGIEFARLLEGFDKFPLLTDGDGGVLSMPPIINSEHTRVTDTTTSFFIDVTGTNRRLVGRTLNVLTTSLVELCPDIEVEQVTIVYPGEEVVTPDYSSQTVTLNVAATARLIGIDIDEGRLADLLFRMGHDVRPSVGGSLWVDVPAYRNDILHPRDLMEDAAIAYGYHNIRPVLVPTMTVGGERAVEAVSRVARDTLCGLGFMEVMTLQLTSEEKAYDALRIERREDHAAVSHPISNEQTMLRPSLAPGLLDTLTVNAHREYPQQIFEVGEVTELTDTDTGAGERRRAAGAVIGEKMGVTEVRAAAESVLREFGWSIRTDGADLPTFLPGRGGRIVAVRDGEERVVGELGELHPEVLEAFKLRHPAALFEIDLTTLTGER